MKKLIYLYSISLIMLIGFQAAAQQQTNEKPGDETYTGILHQEDFKNHYYSWFSPGYTAFKPSKTTINQIAKHINNYNIKVFMGTWCSDSQREIPHLYKILELANYDLDNLEVYTMDEYKTTAANYEKDLDIQFVPSILFFDKNGEEVNRIVEFPQETLEADILKIITGQEYKNVYAE